MEATTTMMMIVAMTMSNRVTLVVGKVASLKGSSDDFFETCMAFFMTA
jgi:hypothetical protein